MSQNTTIEPENTKKLAKKSEEDQESQQNLDQDVSIAETPEGPPVVIINNIEQPTPAARDYPRTISLYGDVSEKMGEETVNALYYLNENGYYQQESADDPEEILVLKKPIKVIVSTYGGSAAEMFSIHDTMRAVREETTIETVGHGKVMSAGVLLLAAGTKGKRKIGANCRVMIHSVIGGNHGSIHNLENEMEEIRNSQDTYMEALVKETSLTKRTLKKLLERKVNIYLSASEAVEYGIADIIV